MSNVIDFTFYQAKAGDEKKQRTHWESLGAFAEALNAHREVRPEWSMGLWTLSKAIEGYHGKADVDGTWRMALVPYIEGTEPGDPTMTAYFINGFPLRSAMIDTDQDTVFKYRFSRKEPTDNVEYLSVSLSEHFGTWSNRNDGLYHNQSIPFLMSLMLYQEVSGFKVVGIDESPDVLTYRLCDDHEKVEITFYYSQLQRTFDAIKAHDIQLQQ